MVFEVRIPKLGLTMKEARIQKWTRSDGEWVKKGDVIVIIETDKVSYEMEAPGSGYLLIIVSREGPHPVGTLLGIIATERIEYNRLKEESYAPSLLEEISRKGEIPEEGQPQVHFKEKDEERIRSSPLARKIAREHGIDLSKISGTGPGGRIVREDVLKEIEKIKGVEKEGFPFKEVGERIPFSSMRKIISERMQESLKISAQMTITMEVDATEFVKLRMSLIEKYKKEGIKVSYNAILMKICGYVLKCHPRINSSIVGNELIIWKNINIGIAMELEDGLIVPVVKDVDRKSIYEIQKGLEDLYERVRKNRILPDDIQGGTFTITNLGSLDVDVFTPIINQPENAILGVGRIVDRPGFSEEGSIIKRKKMPLSLTCDHRAIDGARGARFLKMVKEYIEAPYLLIE